MWKASILLWWVFQTIGGKVDLGCLNQVSFLLFKTPFGIGSWNFKAGVRKYEDPHFGMILRITYIFVSMSIGTFWLRNNLLSNGSIELSNRIHCMCYIGWRILQNDIVVRS